MNYDTLKKIGKTYTEMFLEPNKIELPAWCIKNGVLYVIRVGENLFKCHGAIPARSETLVGSFNENEYDWDHIAMNCFIQREDLIKMNWIISDSLNVYWEFKEQLQTLMKDVMNIREGLQVLRESMEDEALDLTAEVEDK